jgi:hypothetical protein
MNFTHKQVIEFILTDLRFATELPNHCQIEETRAILADYKRKVPQLYAEADRLYVGGGH